MTRGPQTLQEWAETVAIQALNFLADDPERLARFLALSGIGPQAIRDAAREPEFLAGVLDHIAGDERLLVAFADDCKLAPKDIMAAQEILAGPPKGAA
jgi:hypothetical protein